MKSREMRYRDFFQPPLFISFPFVFAVRLHLRHVRLVYAIENHSFIYSLICMLVVPCYLFPTISNDEIAEYAHT